MHPKYSGVFVIVINKEHKFLLGKRLNSYKAGFYGFPGGRLELNETIVECGKRELLEETGLIAKSLKFVGVIREQQEGYNFIHIALVCDKYEGLPKLLEPNKCENWDFYSPDKIINNLLPGHKAGLDIFLTKNRETYRDLLK